MDLLLYIIGLSFIPIMTYVIANGMLDIYHAFKDYSATLRDYKGEVIVIKSSRYKPSVPYELIA